MGCPVNGPGEAKNADIGLAGGINSYLVFIKGKPVKTLSGPDSVTEFLKMVDQVVDEREKCGKKAKIQTNGETKKAQCLELCFLNLTAECLISSTSSKAVMEDSTFRML